MNLVVNNDLFTQIGSQPVELPFVFREYSADQLPEPAAITEKCKKFIGDVQKWDKWKRYGPVQTHMRMFGDEYWFARYSTHVEPLSHFKGLLEDHTKHEVEYIPTANSYRTVATKDDWTCFAIEYSLPFPFKKREMVEWITTIDLNDAFLIISFPSNLPASPNTVKGKYLSIEYLYNDGVLTHWTMACCSDAGGFITKRMQKMALAKEISHDVSYYLQWAEKLHK
ncbi:hypothetical protein CANCADRAFT_124595 [Tortispora caseinolytica NRRL Y-17796]|uniref:DUF3074 domain-containing protein n=1 Tax=Tortispora caseinolytica NRRL Y-17796 TaxID=767744 RepID=A0A1E4T9Z6_9ASCO|nr:hypothetical protein CANCADRAFT_124595 [Tortispora caseinolytica NRRL Y-17796]